MRGGLLLLDTSAVPETIVLWISKSTSNCSNTSSFCPSERTRVFQRSYVASECHGFQNCKSEFIESVGVACDILGLLCVPQLSLR